MIYFAQPVDGGPIKIGCTKNVETRIRALSNHYRQPLVVLATMDGGRDVEHEIHEQFSHLRFGRTEQFRPASELLEFIGVPLLVGLNPDAIEESPVLGNTCTIIHMKGSPEYVDWLEEMHRKTRIPKVQLFRIAMEEWAAKHSHKAPPEI